MEMLYMATSGAADTTRASIPLHLAVNGSVEAGHTVGLILAGDATELAKGATRESVEGLGCRPCGTCSPRPASTTFRSTSERAARSPVGRPKTIWSNSAANG